MDGHTIAIGDPMTFNILKLVSRFLLFLFVRSVYCFLFLLLFSRTQYVKGRACTEPLYLGFVVGVLQRYFFYSVIVMQDAINMVIGFEIIKTGYANPVIFHNFV